MNNFNETIQKKKKKKKLLFGITGAAFNSWNLVSFGGVPILQKNLHFASAPSIGWGFASVSY